MTLPEVAEPIITHLTLEVSPPKKDSHRFTTKGTSDGGHDVHEIEAKFVVKVGTVLPNGEHLAGIGPVKIIDLTPF